MAIDIRNVGEADFTIGGTPYRAMAREFRIEGVEDFADDDPKIDPSRVVWSGTVKGVLTRGVEVPTITLPPPGPRTGMSIIVRDTKTKDRWGRLESFDVTPEGGLAFRVADEGIAESLVSPTFRGAKLRVWFGGNRLTVTIPAGAVTRNPDGSFSGELRGNFGYFAEL